MIIYPTLTTAQGPLVNLGPNRIDSPIIYDLDPIQAARGTWHRRGRGAAARGGHLD